MTFTKHPRNNRLSQTWASTCDLLPRVEGQLGRQPRTRVFPWDPPALSAPQCPRRGPSRASSKEWRVAPACRPLRKAWVTAGWASASTDQGASAAGLAFSLKFWGSEWTPGQPWGGPADEVRPRLGAGAGNRPRSCPDWTHLLLVWVALGRDPVVLDGWSCLVFHVACLFYLGLYISRIKSRFLSHGKTSNLLIYPLPALSLSPPLPSIPSPPPLSVRLPPHFPPPLSTPPLFLSFPPRPSLLLFPNPWPLLFVSENHLLQRKLTFILKTDFGLGAAPFEIKVRVKTWLRCS